MMAVEGTAGSTYELTVLGELGPVLLVALPHDAAAYRPPRRVVVVDVTADDLPAVLELLVAAGVEVESLRAVDPHLRAAG